MFFISEKRTAYSHLHCIDLFTGNTSIKDFDWDLDLDSESCSFSGHGLDLDLAVAGLDTSLEGDKRRSC